MPTSIKDNDKIEFPIKTAVCEVTDYKGSKVIMKYLEKSMLVSAFMREAILKMESSCYEYGHRFEMVIGNNPGKLDCTWHVSGIFCLGLLWLIKNKSYL